MQAKQEITELFDAAAKRQIDAKGEEFSKQFNELVVAP